MNFLLDDSYTPEEERSISNHSTIEMCEHCGDYFPITERFCDEHKSYPIRLTLEGNFYCEKCKSKRPLNSLAKKEFDELKNSGMLWELYPEAPEQYEQIEE